MVDLEANRSKRKASVDLPPPEVRRSIPLSAGVAQQARRLGIRVEIVPMPPDESGSIDMPVDGVAVIRLNRWDSENRQRFTCGHEIGHYLRRAASGGRGSFIDYRDTLAGLGTDVEEVYANQVAAALLMPAHLVRRWFEIESTEKLARRFGTSAQAMVLRLRNLRLA